MAPSVLFTNNAITHDIQNNNASIETTKNSQDLCLRIASQFKVRHEDLFPFEYRGVFFSRRKCLM